MKKFLAILLSLATLLSLAACSAPSEIAPTQTEPTTEPHIADMTTLTTPLWSLTYDKSLWVIEEDDLYEDEDYVSLALIIPDGEEDYITDVFLSVSFEDEEDFRNYLQNYGFDAYEYVENNAYERVNLGGVECVVYAAQYMGEGGRIYIGRVEGASITVFVKVIGKVDTDAVTELFDGLEIFAKDVGHKDAPWPWNGKAFSAQDKSFQVGAYTVNSQWIPFDEGILIDDDSYYFRIGAYGEKVYLLNKETKRFCRYHFDGSSLNFDEALEVAAGYDQLDVATDGSAWLSGHSVPTLRFKDGEKTPYYTSANSVFMHPDGTWGIDWYNASEFTKLTFTDEDVITSDIAFDHCDYFYDVSIDEDYIYVFADGVDGSRNRIFVYDHNAELQMILAHEYDNPLSSIVFIAQTDNGFLAVDTAADEVILWDADGTFIGAISACSLFSTSDPYIRSGVKLDDGSMLIVISDKRADKSAMELFAFKLTVE